MKCPKCHNNLSDTTTVCPFCHKVLALTCPNCHTLNHNAVCSKCGAQTQVPFKPVPGREVFCKECFAGVKEEQAPAEE